MWFLRSKSALRGSAVLFFVLIGKWLQPSGFTQNVERTHRILSGQDVIFQSLGVITSHSPHDNALEACSPARTPRELGRVLLPTALCRGVRLSADPGRHNDPVPAANSVPTRRDILSPGSRFASGKGKRDMQQ